MVPSFALRATEATCVAPSKNVIDPISGCGTYVTRMSMDPVAATIWIVALRLSDFPPAVTVNVTVQVPIVVAVKVVDGAAGLVKVPQPFGAALQAKDS